LPFFLSLRERAYLLFPLSLRERVGVRVKTSFSKPNY